MILDRHRGFLAERPGAEGAGPVALIREAISTTDPGMTLSCITFSTAAVTAGT